MTKKDESIDQEALKDAVREAIRAELMNVADFQKLIRLAVRAELRELCATMATSLKASHDVLKSAPADDDVGAFAAPEGGAVGATGCVRR